MFITRKLGGVLRGEATPFQLLSASILGGLIGFIPIVGPDLLARLLLLATFGALLAILNANLFLAGLVALGTKLLAMAILPVVYGAGRLLLDGPTQPIFKAAINAPVLALYGLEHYVVSGGLLIGLLVGGGIGLGVVYGVGRFRRLMASLEEGSERYRHCMSKRWVRVLTWLMLGPGCESKDGYAALLHRRMGNPIRPLGVAFAVLLVGLGVVLRLFLSEPLVTAAVQRGLERANGATVDLASADLSLGEGTMTLTGLAMADPNALDTNLLEAQTLEVNLATADLLRKRMAFDRVVVRDAAQGSQRRFPGRIIGRPPEPPPPPAGPGKTIEDYLKDAEVWRDRLAQVRRWIEQVSQRDPDAPAPDGQRRETLNERLRRQVREQGYAFVRAEHLVEGAPRVVVRELVIDGVTIAAMPGDPLDVRGENLSTQPWLLERGGTLSARSRSGALTANLDVAPTGQTTLAATRTGVDAETIASMLAASPISGGRVDLALSANLIGATIDAPLQVTLHNSTLTIPGAGSKRVERFAMPIALRGPIDNPRIAIDEQALADALVQAGARELAGQVREEIGEQLGEEASGALQRLLGGEKKKPEEEPPGD